jgi:signal transduction histidine kinase
MTISASLKARISGGLLRYRWWAVALLGLVSVLFELVEHIRMAHPVDPHFVREMLLFGVIFPALGGMLLTFLARTERERGRAVEHVALQSELNQRLARAQTWDELATALVRFPATVAPLSGASLLVYDQEHNRFEPAAEWGTRNGASLPGLASFLPSTSCLACAGAGPISVHQLSSGRCPSTIKISSQGDGYCLPLVHSHASVALLRLYPPPGVLLGDSQIMILNNLAPSMALAVDAARPQGSAMVRAEATAAERRRIARQLHDTLGQNLAYLRLKLDQLTGGNTLQEIAAIQQELAHMREVADEAYTQVRGTLATLHPDHSADLAAALLTQATTVGDQADFEVKITSQGSPQALAPLVQHQILYLFQEALANVARHAGAKHVDIDLTWASDTLTINLADDGRGFEPGATQTNGHLGMTIMRERAAEINGLLTFTSRPDHGIQVTLRVPLG